MAGLVQKFKQMWTPPEDEYDYDFEEMDMDDEEVMDEISSGSYEEEEAYQELEKNPDAKKLRCYMQILTVLLRKDYGQKINEQLKGQMKKPAEIEELQHPVAELKKMGEEFWMPNADVMAYTKKANQRITALLDSCVELFPQCIDKKYIRSLLRCRTDRQIKESRLRANSI